MGCFFKLKKRKRFQFLFRKRTGHFEKEGKSQWRELDLWAFHGEFYAVASTLGTQALCFTLITTSRDLLSPLLHRTRDQGSDRSNDWRRVTKPAWTQVCYRGPYLSHRPPAPVQLHWEPIHAPQRQWEKAHSSYFLSHNPAYGLFPDPALKITTGKKK